MVSSKPENELTPREPLPLTRNPNITFSVNESRQPSYF